MTMDGRYPQFPNGMSSLGTPVPDPQQAQPVPASNWFANPAQTTYPAQERASGFIEVLTLKQAVMAWRRAWAKAGEGARRDFARHLLGWAVDHADLWFTDVIRAWARGSVIKMIYEMAPEESKQELAKCIIDTALKELKRSDWSARDLVREAMVVASRRSLAKVAREEAIASLAHDATAEIGHGG